MRALLALALTSLFLHCHGAESAGKSGKAALQGRDGAVPRALQAGDETPLQRVLARYLDNEELEAHLQDFAERCSSIARLTSIGTSVEGRELHVLEISDRAGQVEAEPNVRMVGNLHGDEPSGRVFTLALAEWLCANYGEDAAATSVVNDVHLWLLPSANPDGFERRTRHNQNGRDLNRNFPDRFGLRGMHASGREEPEVRALMEWGAAVPFTASLALHEGALVANYPWDGTPNKTTEYAECPDDVTFRHLALAYATAHRAMGLPTNKEFPDGGITNGAAWYPIYGSMQDWSYIVDRCMELTLELSESKYPAEESLAGLFEDNREAMLLWAVQAPLGG
jgi:carboxypeptidase D